MGNAAAVLRNNGNSRLFASSKRSDLDWNHCRHGIHHVLRSAVLNASCQDGQLHFGNRHGNHVSNVNRIGERLNVHEKQIFLSRLDLSNKMELNYEKQDLQPDPFSFWIQVRTYASLLLSKIVEQ